MNDEVERLAGNVPGPRSLELADWLRTFESRGVTYLAPDFPVFWDSASEALVTDADGNRFIDCTGAFGVATTGHANPAVVEAIAKQAAKLPHAMGDVHPSTAKAKLLDRLAKLVPLDSPRSFLACTGAEAVEWALKTAYLATESPHVLAFAGGYHGLSYGTLEVCGMPKFRAPFRKQMHEATSFTRFPDRREKNGADRALTAIAKALKKDGNIGAVVIEPIQGRAGVVIPPDGFLKGLRALCSEHDAILIVDEIYTGLGRTGSMFAFERDGIVPDIVCIGKALGGGFPISAAVARREVADAWPASTGEALHTSTFLGNPMGCAAACANLDEIERLDIPRIARERGEIVAERMATIARAYDGIVDVRGRGMLWAIEFKMPETADALVRRALQRGVILLQSGIHGESVTFAPPPVIGAMQLKRATDIIANIVHDMAASR
jgi:4-aminobutyrate aminotransferase-like enzyme